MRAARIDAVAMYVPDRHVSNDEYLSRFSDRLQRNQVAMLAMSGIRGRNYADPAMATSDLALAAVEKLLHATGIDRAEIDLVVVATDTPDYITPATSTILQHKLGLSKAGAFDVNCACASFPVALANASSLIIANKNIRKAIVVGAYLMSRLADPEDPSYFFYGDGAGAVLVSESDEPGFLGFSEYTDGSMWRHWGIFAGGTANPYSPENHANGHDLCRFVEPYSRNLNVEEWPKVLERACESAAVGIGDLDLVLFTQISEPSIRTVMESLGLPMSKTHTIMKKWGYTGSACLPMALHDWLRETDGADNALVALVGSGVGVNFASTVLRLDRPVVC